MWLAGNVLLFIGIVLAHIANNGHLPRYIPAVVLGAGVVLLFVDLRLDMKQSEGDHTGN